MRMKTYDTFDAYLANQKPRNKKIIEALRRFVKRHSRRLSETVKWGNGCWVSTSRPVAYVYSDKEYVQFGFFRGATLKDPKRLLEGNGKFVRHVKVRAPSEIDTRSFGALLKQ